MDYTSAIFYILSAVMLVASLRVITARNPVHAALFLVLAFFNAAGIWMLLEAEFLALTLIVVYVGAGMVLFLFVVMMLDINLERLRQGFWSNLWLGGPIALMMVIEMAMVLSARLFADAPAPPAAAAGHSNTKEVGRLLYTNYYYPFELASVVLLVAIIAAIALTLRKRKDTKYLKASQQVAVKRNDRLRIVSVPSEKE